MTDLLYTTTMQARTATNKSGFDRNSTNRLGHVTNAYVPAGILNSTTNTASRIVRLFLDTSGTNQVTFKTNRKEDFRGKWLRVGDDWLDLDLDATGVGDQEKDYPISSEDNWSTTAWTAGQYLPVGIYDGPPDSGSTLNLPQPVMLWSAEMTVGNSGDNWGWSNASPDIGEIYRPGTTTTDRSVDADGGGRDLAHVYYVTTSGSEGLSIRAGSADNARRISGLWWRFRTPDKGDFVTQVTGSTAAMTIATQPDDPEWAANDVVTIEIWDNHPEIIVSPDGQVGQPGEVWAF